MIILTSITVLTAEIANLEMFVNVLYHAKSNVVPVLNATRTVIALSRRYVSPLLKLLMSAMDVPKKYIADLINTSIELPYQTKSIKPSWLKQGMELIKHLKTLNAWIPLSHH